MMAQIKAEIIFLLASNHYAIKGKNNIVRNVIKCKKCHLNILKIKIKAYQVPFQNMYGLLWFRVQFVDELKQI